MRAVWIVGLTLLKESSRNKIFYGILAFAVLFIASANVIAELAPRANVRIVLDFGMFAISIFGVIIAIVMGVMQLHKEVQQKTIHSIVSKPISRAEFLVGKFVGMSLILLMTMLALSLVWVGIILLEFKKSSGIQWHEAVIYLKRIPETLAMFYIEQVLVVAFAIFFSAFSSPILSGVFTTGFFLVGRSIPLVLKMTTAKKGYLAGNSAANFFASRIYPNLDAFNFSQEFIQQEVVPTNHLLHTAAYGLWYAAIFLIVGIVLFNRRDFA